LTKVATLGPDTVAYGNTGLKPRLLYTYTVCATDLVGANECSDKVTVNGPTQIKAVPGATGVDLTWKDNADDETGFRSVCIQNDSFTVVESADLRIDSHAVENLSKDVRSVFTRFNCCLPVTHSSFLPHQKLKLAIGVGSAGGGPRSATAAGAFMADAPCFPVGATGAAFSSFCCSPAKAPGVPPESIAEFSVFAPGDGRPPAPARLPVDAFNSVSDVGRRRATLPAPLVAALFRGCPVPFFALEAPIESTSRYCCPAAPVNRNGLNSGILEPKIPAFLGFRMDIALSTVSAVDAQVDLLVVACDEETLGENTHVSSLDRALGGSLLRSVIEERFRGSSGQTLVLHTQERVPARRIALLGLGAKRQQPLSTLRPFAARAARLANSNGSRRVALVPPLGLLASPAGNLAQAAQLLTEGLLLGCYRFDKYLAEDKRSPQSLQNADLLLGASVSSSDSARAIARGESVATAAMEARDWVNEPAGFLTPTELAAIARTLADRHSLELTVLGPKECQDRAMGLFLAVAQGSVQEPRFIHLAWKPPGAKKRIVLIGKGVTFDSGGLSLKPNDGMLDMKTDMAGAAAVISVMSAVAREELPVEVHALAACTENMPSGRAYKLGDVLRSKAGKSVEINNTDAEGRLTLADAISYGADLQPTAIFDFATLTGACMVALGPHTAGVMSNNDGLCAEWLAAAAEAGEDMWRLPLPERLFEQLKSDVADMKNTGERWGGALTAGLFLKEFVGEIPWVHVDLAGPSTSDKEFGHLGKGGTGFGVFTIFEYLRRIAGSEPTGVQRAKS
jgi:leucyl aminopeptidase